ncbi:MAG: hypothetical protein H6R18_288 [Proteobacteria bacterium]|nr:hypothetical protein [Pseudomonadota bacterium]
MSADKKLFNHNIFLIKQGYTTSDLVLNKGACDPAIKVQIPGCGAGQLFIKKTHPTPPKWASLFGEYLDLAMLAVPGVSAAFFIQVNGRCFVLAFGQGGRFLLKDDVYEERFGLLCALNSVDPESFRCVDVQSLDAIQSHTRIQSGQATTPDQFGLDVEQDMLKAIVGAPLDEALGTRMAGSDSLSVAVKMSLSDLPFLLDEYRKKFEADLSANDHQWVNNISITKSTAVIVDLEKALDAKLVAKDFKDIWLSIPEIINWATVQGFMFMHGGKEVHPDITLNGFLKTVGVGTTLSLDLFRQRKVYCADAEHKRVLNAWPVFKCLYAEIDLNEKKYILNDGKWFTVAMDFVAKTNADFSKIPASKLELPEYKGGGEGTYNADVAKTEPELYALLDDTKKIMHGGGYGQVEICDLLSIDGELIHVKMYGKSSVFSHLFAQGFVSGQLIQIDPEFRQKVRGQLVAPFINLIRVDEKPTQDELTIVYAVISNAKEKNLYLPFFSRVNANNATKVLKGYGYKVELLKIGVDEMHSKTTKIPPKKKSKKAA